MGARISGRYRKAAAEFSRRVVAELGEEVDSIVLYGSVARGEARKDSDIDILLISQNPKMIRERVSEIEDDLAYERSYEFLITPVILSKDDFQRLLSVSSAFIDQVMIDGVILYDNGEFSRASREALGIR